MIITVKGWKKHQHYSHRNPPWIKFHKELLDDFAFNCLQDASKWLLLRIWLIASEYQDGIIDTNEQQISFRLRIPVQQFKLMIIEIQTAGFIDVINDASVVLAECLWDATTETETETETEKSKEKKKPLSEYSDDFLSFWDAYPNKTGKGMAYKSWKHQKPMLQKVLDSLSWQSVSQKWQEGFIPNPATYINQRRWEDEPQTEVNRPVKRFQTIEEIKMENTKQAMIDFVNQGEENGRYEREQNPFRITNG